eukprot:TRINITY_DN7464_c0_g3_i1.p1 TRINITY_DN7464_c0_g3~~TRINITY_DN7464_c0_g3_i1.p1  ORF type:complete len:148 (-),score=21.48 TRINITY_DN7464_c0_g3_i1:596-1039(-)
MCVILVFLHFALSGMFATATEEYRPFYQNFVTWQHHHEYRDTLARCILFFEGQRSGKLPVNQRLKGRRDSALRDGFAANVCIFNDGSIDASLFWRLLGSAFALRCFGVHLFWALRFSCCFEYLHLVITFMGIEGNLFCVSELGGRVL